jgi:hypothetical protein
VIFSEALRILNISDESMSDELERNWKEVVVICSMYYLNIYLGGLRKTTKILVRVVLAYWDETVRRNKINVDFSFL